MQGDIMICFPEDAHAPAIGNGVIRKAIAKVICHENTGQNATKTPDKMPRKHRTKCHENTD